jgi:HSP20 family protein
MDNFQKKLSNYLDQWMPVISPKTRGRTVGYPLTDLIDEETCYIVEAELPGVQSKDLDVEVTADTVKIKGELDPSSDEEELHSKYLIKERRRQVFNKEIIFPECVNPQEAEAKLEGGVLWIKVPKKEPETLEIVKIEVK